ncbi:hypothetical protein [Planobispora takensis]|uniref:Uncharacterized protein n=1 Tax=Planobispora takensis TaxID=1367882 RepID=A0A8J3T315_9ACTN|nr:hypothetical protein [Planobispora takensis]GII04813.1 hypothetical protein Pta02_68210 [Planobispora takensis]
MYEWIWRMLSGGPVAKMCTALVLAGMTAAVLWYVVFPWIEPYVLFDRATMSP